jgi:hypothetical protein
VAGWLGRGALEKISCGIEGLLEGGALSRGPETGPSVVLREEGLGGSRVCGLVVVQGERNAFVVAGLATSRSLRWTYSGG